MSLKPMCSSLGLGENSPPQHTRRPEMSYCPKSFEAESSNQCISRFVLLANSGIDFLHSALAAQRNVVLTQKCSKPISHIIRPQKDHQFDARDSRVAHGL